MKFVDLRSLPVVLVVILCVKHLALNDTLNVNIGSQLQFTDPPVLINNSLTSRLSMKSIKS